MQIANNAVHPYTPVGFDLVLLQAGVKHFKAQSKVNVMWSV